MRDGDDDGDGDGDVDCPVLFEGAESGTLPAGWSTNGKWDVDGNNPATGDFCFSDEPSGQYDNGTDRHLELAPATPMTSGNLSVSFAYRLAVEEGDDVAHVDTSTDGGNSWNRQRSRSQNQPGWTVESFLLPINGGQPIRVRFGIDVDGNNNADGFFVDDITIQQSTCP